MDKLQALGFRLDETIAKIAQHLQNKLERTAD
jgi:hypothetical protein